MKNLRPMLRKKYIWAFLAAVLLCAAVAVGFLAKPHSEEPRPNPAAQTAQSAVLLLLSCTQEQAAQLEEALQSGMTPPPQGAGIQSGGLGLEDWLEEYYQGQLTPDCIGKLLANRSFYRAAQLATTHNADIHAADPVLTQRGQTLVYDYTADVMAGTQIVGSADGTVTMEESENGFRVTNLTLRWQEQ